jgi:hypothetical protein
MKYAAYLLLFCSLPSVVWGQSANDSTTVRSADTSSCTGSFIPRATAAIREAFQSLHEEVLNALPFRDFVEVSQLEEERDEEMKAQIANGTLPASADVLVRVRPRDQVRRFELKAMAQAQRTQK